MGIFDDFVDKISNAVSDVVKSVDPTDPNSLVRSGLRDIDPTDPNSSLRQSLAAMDPTNVLEPIALPLAQAWKNEHPNATGTDEDYHDCVLVVAAGAAAAGAAMGGPAGAAIGAGGGVAIAGLVCRRVM